MKCSESRSVVSDSLGAHELICGILQARILEWIAFPFSRGSSQPRSPALQVDSLPAEPQGKPLIDESEVKVAQSCPTLCDPMDYTVHGILQARILEWIGFPFSRGSSQPRDRTQVSCIAGGFFTNWAIREAPNQSRWQWSNHHMTNVKMTGRAYCTVSVWSHLPLYIKSLAHWLSVLGSRPWMGRGWNPPLDVVAGIQNKANFPFHQPCL